MSKAFLVVEGQGDQKAALNLIIRLWRDLELGEVNWNDPIRGLALHTKAGIEKACSLVRNRDVRFLLILRDEDDACPKTTGPLTADWIRGQRLGFPAAIVLAHREYEAWFLPCLEQMAGKPLIDERGVRRPGIRAGSKFEGNPESLRGVKEWLSEHFEGNRTYKPTLDQLILTRMIDIRMLRAARVPSFETLEHALQFLAGNPAPGSVYPPAATTAV